ncbi:Dna2/Cas4 domain-containing protein [Aquamicrobium sp.]|uniref:Dna2/Cas4 domain-containing protein n=1 Tax=Aquamicrobium sp. TaxID=1872579 RepID=UPI00258F159C|nr:Dna2/Cas4 domain-containing protein [Aquamicrobium sp.]MCK9549267.1 CRISPR-associated protein Cas4 [Aquamicrobium sp.]
MFRAEDINGTIVKSFIACRRQGALALRRMSPLYQNPDIQMGSVYAKLRNKSARFGGIEIDEVSKNKHIVIKEYKKTFSNIEASKMQLLYYMHSLKNELNCRTIEGYVISEETDEKLHVLLDEQNINIVQEMINDIIQLSKEEIPKIEKKALCLHCAYNLYCL